MVKDKKNEAGFNWSEPGLYKVLQLLIFHPVQVWLIVSVQIQYRCLHGNCSRWAANHSVFGNECFECNSDVVLKIFQLLIFDIVQLWLLISLQIQYRCLHGNCSKWAAHHCAFEHECFEYNSGLKFSCCCMLLLAL